MTLLEAIAVIEAQREIIERQALQLAAQAREIERLTAMVARLEERLNKSSGNSNKPPSSDSVYRSPAPAKPEGRAKRKKRTWGKSRDLLPAEAVDRAVVVKPETCSHCGDRLSGEEVEGEVWRHQVVEIPVPKAELTEYQLHACRCERCGAVTRAGLPEGVGASPFGPRLTATMAMLSVGYRLSKRQVQRLIETMWGIKVSRGGVSQCEQRVSAAINASVEALVVQVKQASVLYADETPWKQRHRLHWLWSSGTETAWVFRIEAKRSKESAQALLGPLTSATLVADDYTGYKWVIRRQQCWSHLLRRFVAMMEFKADLVAQRVGRIGLDRIPGMMSLYRAYRAGWIDLRYFRRRMRKVRKAILWALGQGSRSTSPWTRSKCKGIEDMGESLWAFIENPDEIEPTNNRAERAQRHAVLYRKISLGTQSDAGSRFVERMLTVVETLRLQGRNLLAYLEEALVARLHGRAPPQLLPAPGP